MVFPLYPLLVALTSSSEVLVLMTILNPITSCSSPMSLMRKYLRHFWPKTMLSTLNQALETLRIDYHLFMICCQFQMISLWHIALSHFGWQSFQTWIMELKNLRALIPTIVRLCIRGAILQECTTSHHQLFTTNRGLSFGLIQNLPSILYKIFKRTKWASSMPKLVEFFLISKKQLPLMIHSKVMEVSLQCKSRVKLERSHQVNCLMFLCFGKSEIPTLIMEWWFTALMTTKLASKQEQFRSFSISAQTQPTPLEAKTWQSQDMDLIARILMPKSMDRIVLSPATTHMVSIARFNQRLMSPPQESHRLDLLD